MNKDTVWKMWMEAIREEGPDSPEAEKLGELYTILYLEEHDRLP